MMTRKMINDDDENGSDDDDIQSMENSVCDQWKSDDEKNGLMSEK